MDSSVLGTTIKTRYMKYSKTFLWMAVLFNVCIIASNLFASKIFTIGGNIMLPAAVIIFPITYIINDCLSEVYGYRSARMVIRMGFLLSVFFALISQLVLMLPSAPFWEGDAAFETAFGSVPKVTIASLLAFVVGSNVNALILSKMKVKSEGKRFGVRAIISSLGGELCDSLIFMSIVFWNNGIQNIATMILCQVSAKVIYEIVLLPLTSYIVKKVKKLDNTDVYDDNSSYKLI